MEYSKSMKLGWGLVLLVVGGCSRGPAEPPIQFAEKPKPAPQTPKTPEDKLIAALREQVSWGTKYEATYERIAYPGGDLPKERGVCTDVIVRAYRAMGFDLQQLVYEDAKADISR